jgi:hypothetical protein
MTPCACIPMRDVSVSYVKPLTPLCRSSPLQFHCIFLIILSTRWHPPASHAFFKSILSTTRISTIIWDAVKHITLVCMLSSPLPLHGGEYHMSIHQVLHGSPHRCPPAASHLRVANPFPWMTSIFLQRKTNFFERCAGEYAKCGVKHITLVSPKN